MCNMDEPETTETEATEPETTETETPEAEAKTEPETVPYERLKEVTAKASELEEANQMLQEQIALMRANPPQPQAEKQEQFDIYKEVGLEDPDDIPTVEQQRKINEYYQGLVGEQLADIRFFVDHPDYAELVGTAEKIAIGQFAEPLTAAIKANPALVAMIQNSQNRRLAAYEIAKLHKSKKEPISSKDAKTAIDEAVSIANRVKSSSNVKGGGALSEQGRYESMAEEEFVKLAREHGADV